MFLCVVAGVAAIRELYQMTPVGIGRLPVLVGIFQKGFDCLRTDQAVAKSIVDLG